MHTSFFSSLRFRRGWREVVAFGAVGVLATALHYGLYALLLGWMRPGVAYTLGYALSLAANFWLNSVLTFRVKASARRGVGFVLAHAVNYLLHISLLQLFLALGLPPRWAPLPVFAIAVPVNFVLVRLALRGRRRADGYDSKK